MSIGPGPGSVAVAILSGDPAGGDWDEVNWDAGTWADVIWNDIGCQVLEATTRWGTGQEFGVLTVADAGELDITTFDPDRILDPLNDQSPLYGALTPGARVRITAMLPAGQRVAGSGFIDTASYDVASAQGRIRAVDGVAMLAQAQIAEDVTLPDTLRARVRAVVAAVGLAEIITVQADTPEMGPDPPVSPWPIPSKAANAWAVIDDASTDALVYVWVDPSSVLRFADFGAFPAAPFAIGCAPPAPPADDYRSTILATPGLVGYWRLGETSGVAAADENGAHPGAYTNAPTLGVSGATPDGNTGVTLDGVNQYVNFPGSLLDILVDVERPVQPLASPEPLATWAQLGDVVTMEAWVNRNGGTFAGLGGIISKGAGAYYMRMDGTSGQFFFVRSAVASLCPSTANVPATGWHHLVGTKNGATIKLYLDGADVTGAVSNSTLVNDLPPLVFGRDSGAAEYFKGSIDEVALYSVALSPATVADHYAAASAAPPPATETWLAGLSTLTSTFAGDGIRNSIRGQSGDVWTDPIVDAPSQALYGPRPFDVPRLPPDLANWAARILADRANAAHTVALGELRPFDLDELALIVELGLQGASSVHVRDDAHGPLIDYQADIVGAHLTVSSVGWNVHYQTMISTAAAQTPARTGDET